MRLASLDPEGPVAAEIAALWWILLALGGAVFVLFLILLVRGLTKKADTSQETAHRLVLGGGVVLPLAVVTFVFAMTLIAMRALPVAGDSDRLTVEITGHQWWWDVVYPDLGLRSANEIYVPVGTEVELRLLAADVVHSFWVPALAGKMDLLPDETTSMVIEAAEAGTYRGVCAEFCGLQHAKMAFRVVAVSEADFAAWIESQGRSPADRGGELGRQVFLDAGCGSCHTIDGTSDGETGPDLTHLASRLTLAAGTFPNTPDHLRSWVSRPQEHKEGVAMQNIDLPEQSLDALLRYLESLE